MTWVKIDDQFPDHPKVAAVGPVAAFLFVAGLCYANRYLTDGFIPNPQVRRLIDADDSDQLAERLVSAHLWERAGDGFQIHDYRDYQPSAEKVLAERAAAKERSKKNRQPSTEESNEFAQPSIDVQEKFGRTSGEPPTNSAESSSPPYPVPFPSPNPDVPAERKRARKPREKPTYSESFEAFWAAYPSGKSSKPRSAEAWELAIADGADVEQIIAGLEAWKQSAAWTDPQYIKLAQNFLKDELWTNPPQAGPAPGRSGPQPFDPDHYRSRRSSPASSGAF